MGSRVGETVGQMGAAFGQVTQQASGAVAQGLQGVTDTASEMLEGASGMATNVAYTRAFWAAAVPFSDGKTYFNFPGLLEEGESAVRASYGANHERLARIKTDYDPENMFRLNQNIRPAA